MDDNRLIPTYKVYRLYDYAEENSYFSDQKVGFICQYTFLPCLISNTCCCFVFFVFFKIFIIKKKYIYFKNIFIYIYIYNYIYLCVCVLWFFLCSVSLLLLSDFLSNLLYSVL